MSYLLLLVLVSCSVNIRSVFLVLTVEKNPAVPCITGWRRTRWRFRLRGARWWRRRKSPHLFFWVIGIKILLTTSVHCQWDKWWGHKKIISWGMLSWFSARSSELSTKKPMADSGGDLGRVVRKPNNTNPGLKVDWGFQFSLVLKCFHRLCFVAIEISRPQSWRT